jgi:hypothetical protein
MKPLVIIDGDPAVYRAAFAVQKTVYETVHETKAGKLVQAVWTDGRKLQAFYKRYPQLTLLSKESHVEVEDESHARQAARKNMLFLLNNAMHEFGVSEIDDLDVEMYLSGPDNFRHKIAKRVGYKSGRTAPPPVHYQVVRDYFTSHWMAAVVHGIEADDQVSIRQRQCIADGRPCVLATIDKDLDQVPGLHYDYKQHVFYTVTDEEARMMFWRQVLSGDSADTVPGCHKLGAVKAERMVQEWQGLTDAEIWAKVLEVYADNIAAFPDRYPEGMTAYDAALETARLVKMMEYEDQLWSEPGRAHENLTSLND